MVAFVVIRQPAPPRLGELHVYVPLSCSHKQLRDQGRLVLRWRAFELIQEGAVDLLDMDAAVLWASENLFLHFDILAGRSRGRCGRSIRRDQRG